METFAQMIGESGSLEQYRSAIRMDFRYAGTHNRLVYALCLNRFPVKASDLIS